MKRQLFRIVLLVIALSMGIWLMSCGTGPQNTNQTSISEDEKSGSDDYDCSQKGIEDEMKRILTGKGGEIKHVADQFNRPNRPPNEPWNIDVRVLAYDNGQKIVVIEGGLSDGRPGNHGKNQEIMELVTIAVDELITRNCVFKAVFVKRGTLARLDRKEIDPLTIEGFDWSSCEWPNIACPGGECKPSCDGLPLETPKPTPKPTQTPTPNANANANANANGNRPGNS